MPTIDERKALFAAQSAINASAKVDFATAYPDAAIGRRFTDANGLTFEVVLLWLVNGRVTIIAAWVNDEDESSSYHQTDFNLDTITWIPLS